MRRILPLIATLTAAVAALVAGCGSERDSVSQSDPTYHGSVLFSVRCAGCHTLDKAGTHGSGTNVRDRARNNGPNFNVRPETVASVLYAIRNGGFSGGIMPQNIVVGQDAVDVAQFVAKYAGTKAKPAVAPPTGQ
jgi:mono/diheme cytochrome c family protein